jgi:L-ascorbate metabolism protein UlaG (beta-lactamase superfamily)
MIIPVTKDDAFLEDVNAANTYNDDFRLWWLGQSGFLLQYRMKHVLFDPYLSDSLTRKYADTEKPHVRMTERVVDPQRLDFVEVVTSSHNHTDHLDRETLLPLLTENDPIHFLLPEANRFFASERLSIDPSFAVGLDAGEKAEITPFTFYAVPAAHNHIEKDEDGKHRYLGFVVQFGEWTIYHSGDTMLYEGIVDTLKPFGIDVALLPINGYRAERKVAGNLSADEAAQLGKDIGARLVIPHHFDMFTFNTEDPQRLVEACERLDQPCRVLRCGERFSGEMLSDGEEDSQPSE